MDLTRVRVVPSDRRKLPEVVAGRGSHGASNERLTIEPCGVPGHTESLLAYFHEHDLSSSSRPSFMRFCPCILSLYAQSTQEQAQDASDVFGVF